MRKIVVLISLVLLTLSSCEIKSRNIVVLGDSNGASSIGWVVKLDSMMVNDSILNFSKGGRTIGFDNLGRSELNELKMVENQLIEADSLLRNIDMILIGLGTNDCKACFDSLQVEVPKNMEKLILFVKNFPYQSGKAPQIILVGPPQVAADSLLLEKYAGIGKRLDHLIPALKSVADEQGCLFIETRSATSVGFESLTQDGIHFNHNGYNVISAEVFNAIHK